MPEPAIWHYVDDRRTHEVRATLERGHRPFFVSTETAFGGSPEDERYVERFALLEPWEAKLRKLALETRLCLLGHYSSRGPDGWTPLRLPHSHTNVDLRPIDLGEPANGTIEFHHFSGEHDRAVGLVGIHRVTERGPRFVLVRIDHEGLAVEKGKLRVLHANLLPNLYRSALASQHVELRERRYRKAPRESRELLDAEPWAALREAFDVMLRRIVVETGVGGDGLHDATGRPLDARSVALLAQARRAAAGAASKERTFELEDECDLAATSVEAKRSDVLIDEIPQDIASALNEPRLVALHDRWLAEGEEARLLQEGHRAIVLRARALREKARPHEQHLVSLLEASLLLRYSFKHRISVDPEVMKRVMHARAYL